MRSILFGVLLLSSPFLAAEDDVENGKELHDGNCVSCHAAMTKDQADTLYTREDRKMTDYNSLYNQVQRCALNLGLKWFDSEISDVSAYLNTQYYQFETGQEEEEKASAETTETEK